MLADPTTCTAGLKAAVSLGFTKPLYGVASCGTTDFSKNAATYAGGVTLTQGNVSPTGDDADAKIFTQAMDKCGKKTEDLFHAIDGFQRHKRLHRPAEVGHEDPGLAGDVRAEEPGVRVHQEGVRGDLVDVVVEEGGDRQSFHLLTVMRSLGQLDPSFTATNEA
jgi:hypothetical protein